MVNMKIKKLFKKMGRSNLLMKPMGVLTNISLPLIYTLHQTGGFVVEDIGEGEVIIKSALLNGLQGSIILMFILISILQIYKPPKAIVISLTLGGIMLFASSLFSTLGVALLLYAGSNLINKYTFEKLIIRNDKVKKATEENEIEMISKRGVKE